MLAPLGFAPSPGGPLQPGPTLSSSLPSRHQRRDSSTGWGAAGHRQPRDKRFRIKPHGKPAQLPHTLPAAALPRF